MVERQLGRAVADNYDPLAVPVERQIVEEVSDAPNDVSKAFALGERRIHAVGALGVNQLRG